MTRLPPVRVARAAASVRTAIQGLTRRMVPPPVAVLELVSGLIEANTVYAVARLGVADVLAGGASHRRGRGRRAGHAPRRDLPSAAGRCRLAVCCARTATGSR